MSKSFFHDLCLRISRLRPDLGRPADIRIALSPYSGRLEGAFRKHGMDAAVRLALSLLSPSDPAGPTDDRPGGPSVPMEPVLPAGATFCSLCGMPRSAADLEGDLCGFCADRRADPSVRALLERMTAAPDIPLRILLTGIPMSQPLMEVLDRWTRARIMARPAGPSCPPHTGTG